MKLIQTRSLCILFTIFMCYNYIFIHLILPNSVIFDKDHCIMSFSITIFIYIYLMPFVCFVFVYMYILFVFIYAFDKTYVLK